ncbi:hypothetical protein C2845_PM05G17630 [Panicum miliaceum]|uniref:Uncharacterized protein n=1 Tax=Panicum miliaceum TaxID=4540 RepID=A0A3L6T0Z6_PANMI|nr:hypothetical protein C2845_PM05G17630 [Panicum miliaceum]
MARRFQGTGEGRETWDSRELGRDSRDGRDMRSRFGNTGRDNFGFQNRDLSDSREGCRDEDQERRGYARQKWMGEEGAGREVRQMTEEVLRHKLNRDQEEKRRAPYQQNPYPYK